MTSTYRSKYRVYEDVVLGPLARHDVGVTLDETEPTAGQTWCFQCGASYEDDVDECVECGVPTTTDKPQLPEAVGDEDDDQLAYELHEWTGQGRSILNGMLTRAGVSHAWQGASLIVKEADEEIVDEAIAQTEIVAMPTLDPSEPTMVYELDELDQQQHARLLRRMGEAGINHAFDREGDLNVYEKDEERVDELFEGLDVADSSEREFGEGVAGVDPVTVMSDMFVAAGRIRRKATDAKGVIGVVETSALIDQMALPYGITADLWGAVVDRSSDLADVLSGDVEVADDVTVLEMAGELHDLLRTMI